jgi:hypothetical protein
VRILGELCFWTQRKGEGVQVAHSSPLATVDPVDC